MADLTQNEADELIQVDKIFEDNSPIVMDRPYKQERKLFSVVNHLDVFYLNMNETAIEFGKYSVNNRFFQIPLVRICIDKDSVHENPDGRLIKGSHLHVYKQEFGDKFADDLSHYEITATNSVQILAQFLAFCHIEKIEIKSQNQIGR